MRRRGSSHIDTRNTLAPFGGGLGELREVTAFEAFKYFV
jgi:hypothetical protein